MDKAWWVAALAIAAASLMPGALAAEDAAAEDPSAESPPVELDYDRGFVLRTTDGRFSLRLNGAVQFRYTFVDYDDRVVGNEENYSNFYMRRARVWWTGHAFSPKLRYFIHLQLEPHRLVNGHDIFLEYELDPLAIVGIGRNKVPYGLEFLNSGFGLNMVERSVMSGESDIDVGGGAALYPGGGTALFRLNWFADTGFATGGLSLYRSQGVWLRGSGAGAGEAVYEYQLGVWQGRGTMGLPNRDDEHLFTLRAGFHPFGFVDYKLQGDGEWRDTPALSVFVSAYQNSSDGTEDFSEHGVNVALQSRYRGLSCDLEWGSEVYDFESFDEDLQRRGWRAQLGAFVLPRRLEIVARWAGIERLENPSYQRALDSGLGVAQLVERGRRIIGIEKRISELSIGANYFINEWHRHKVQLDLSRLRRDFAADPEAGIERAPEQEDLRVRAMVQLFF